MLQNWKKELRIIFLGALLVGMFWTGAQDNGTAIHFLDIGQGDSIFIETESGFQMLIDGGPDDTVLEELRSLMPIGDTTIDWLILSHGDADHLAGMIDVIREYEINMVVMPDYPKESQLFETWLELIAEKDISVQTISDQVQLSPTSEINLSFLHPTPETMYEGISANNASLVFLLETEQIKFLFTGDIEWEAEELLVQEYESFAVDVLKAAHHGSKSSSIPEFLHAAQPEVIVIQVGKGNKFGHPHDKSLYWYDRLGADIYRTDWQGRISFFAQNGILSQCEEILPGFPQILGFHLETVYTKGD